MKIRGFTLVELLLAMAILAILSSIGYSQFRNAQIKSRDAKRKSDAQAIIKALELYKSDTKNASFYPAHSSDCNIVAYCLDDKSLKDSGTSPPYEYLKKHLTDKYNNDADYPYVAYTSTSVLCPLATQSPHPNVAHTLFFKCVRYALIACLEWSDDPNKDSSKNGLCNNPKYNASITYANP